MGLAGLWAVWVGERTSGRRPVVLWANVTGCLWPNKMSLSFLSLGQFHLGERKRKKSQSRPFRTGSVAKKITADHNKIRCEVSESIQKVFFFVFVIT
jgi:hypothetical protein